jgi:hypothetical protein
VSALAFLIACIIFVLAGLGVDVGSLSELDLVAFGLAFVAAGLLLPGVLAFTSSRSS